MTIFGGGPGAVVIVPTQPLLPRTTFSVRADVPYVDASVRGAVLRWGYTYRHLTSDAETCRDEDCYRRRGESYRTTHDLHTHGDPEARWRHGWHEVAAFDLFAGPPRPVSRVVELTVPQDAPPTNPEMLWWQVKAELDLVHARDSVQPAPVIVLPDPAAEPPCLAEKPTIGDSTRFEATTDRRAYRRGDPVLGMLTVWPHEAVRTNGLRLTLVREVRQRRGGGYVERRETPTVPLTGAFDFVPDAPFRVPFRVQLPPDAASCSEPDGFTLHWFVEITVDVKRWVDSLIRIPVTVV